MSSIKKGKTIRKECCRQKEQCARAMNEGLTCGKSGDPLLGLRREVGSAVGGKLGRWARARPEGPPCPGPSFPGQSSIPQLLCCFLWQYPSQNPQKGARLG